MNSPTAEPAAPAGFDSPADRRQQRRHAWTLAICMGLLAAMALPLLWFAWFDGWQRGVSGRLHRTQAEVLAHWHVPGPDRWWVRYRYTDPAGVERVQERSFDTPVAHEAGDHVAAITFLDYHGDPEVEPLSDGLVLISRMLGGLGGFVVLAGGVMLAIQAPRLRWRLRLLREGQAVAGASPALEVRAVPFVRGAPPMWRLIMRRYDPAALAWQDVASDWQHGARPDPAAVALPPILVDPRDPRRAWIPAAGLVASTPR